METYGKNGKHMEKAGPTDPRPVVFFGSFHV